MALNVNHGAQTSSKSQFSIQQGGSLDDVNSQGNRWRIRAPAPPFRHASPTRPNDFDTREDMDRVISCCRHLSSLPQGVGRISRLNILIALAVALRSRFEVGGRLEDIGDSISLFRHIITMVPPGTDNYRYLTSNLACAWKIKYEQTNESRDIAEAISHFRSVLISCPLDHPSRPFYLSDHAELLMSRFQRRGDLSDLEDATTLRQASFDLLDKEHPERMWALMNLALVYHSRFMQTHNSEDLEKAIARHREALHLCPPGHKDKDDLLRNLAYSLTSRFENFGRMDCLEEAISFYRAALCLCPRGHPRRQPSLRGLADAIHLRCLRTHRTEDLAETINLERESLRLTPPGHPLRPHMLYNLSVSLETQYNWSGATGDMRYIDEGIQLLYEASKLAKSGRPHSRHIHQLLAGNLIRRFRHRGADKDIADAIKHYRASISSIPEGNPEVSSLLSNFASNLISIFFQTGNVEHLKESIALSRSAVEYQFSDVHDKLRAAKNWTVAAHFARDSSAFSAYRKALSLLQRAIDLGPTVKTRHEYISGQNVKYLRSLPMDAASYAIESHAYEEAIEMLEQGRALLWSGMRSLRTPLEHLHEVDKSLADEFTKVSQALEAIITTAGDVVQTPVDTDDDDSDVTIGRKDGFARDLEEKRRLSGELDKVVLRIQALPGFENFWRPVPFRQLETAAVGGPLVIINLSEYRSDILIVRSNHPVVHIPTPTNFFDKVTKLAHQLSNTRKTRRLESKEYDRVLRQTLEELSELVGQPVANKLMELGVPEKSRIWLCPTSVLASLPIHASGPIPSDTRVKRYLCDIYVCSYTPSLSALIASRSNNSSESASRQPSLLIVEQPDESLPGVDSETRSIESLVGSSSVTRIADETATPENVIAHLPMHPWVHFACHGMLQPGRPFESSFSLHHNNHLTLLRIAKSHLPTAELAFLAASHTAELTEDGTPDEVLHLTAAMQFSGFRSVIGTMWAMADEDGQDLSKHFYGKMFAAGMQSASYEKSARVLRYATQKLRAKKGISLERWVNFVHYGA